MNPGNIKTRESGSWQQRPVGKRNTTLGLWDGSSTPSFRDPGEVVYSTDGGTSWLPLEGATWTDGDAYPIGFIVDYNGSGTRTTPLSDNEPVPSTAGSRVEYYIGNPDSGGTLLRDDDTQPAYDAKSGAAAVTTAELGGVGSVTLYARCVYPDATIDDHTATLTVVNANPVVSSFTGRLSAIASASTGTTAWPIPWAEANPQAKVITCMIKWHQWEIADNDFSGLATDGTTVDNALRACLQYCIDNNKQLRIRIMAGADAPIGDPDLSASAHPNWLFTTGGVGRIQLISNESGDSSDIYLPDYFDTSSRTNYETYYERMINHLNGILTESYGAGTLGDGVWDVPASAPSEKGSEATLGYGSGGQNQAAWDSYDSANSTTEVSRRATLTQMWKDNIDSMMSILPNNILVSFAGGHFFNDSNAGSDSIIDYTGPLYGARFAAGRTDLRTSATNGGAYTGYRGWGSNGADTIDRAVRHGCTIWFQTAGFINTPTEIAQAVEEVLDEVDPITLKRWNPVLIEGLSSAFLDPATEAIPQQRGTFGGTLTFAQYCFNEQWRLGTATIDADFSTYPVGEYTNGQTNVPKIDTVSFPAGGGSAVGIITDGSDNVLRSSGPDAYIQWSNSLGSATNFRLVAYIKLNSTAPPATLRLVRARSVTPTDIATVRIATSGALQSQVSPAGTLVTVGTTNPVRNQYGLLDITFRQGVGQIVRWFDSIDITPEHEIYQTDDPSDPIDVINFGITNTSDTTVQVKAVEVRVE